LLAVVLLIALRVSIGWHFLYEGVWKIRHADEFSAVPFLMQAKGPAAELFYAMLPDSDGRRRLRTRPVATAKPLIDAWRALRDKVISRYELEELERKGAEVIFWDHQERLEAYLRRENEAIVAFFRARAESQQSGEAEQPLPEQVRRWLAAIGQIEKSYHQALQQLVAGHGPADPKLFQPLVPGTDQKLTLAQVVRGSTIRNPAGRRILGVELAIPGWEYNTAWLALKNEAMRRYRPSPEQRHAIQELYHRYKESAEQYLAANREFIEAHFASVDRFRQEQGRGNAAFQKQRAWERKRELRQEVNQWLSELDGMGQAFWRAVWDVLDEDQRARGMMAEPVPTTHRLPVSLLGIDSVTELFDAAITYGLTAIGVCLVAGLFTRLACVGAGLFLVMVILSQPAWPSIYPPAPPEAGHALLVDKNFVEMVACFALATTAVGRWGGVDFFLSHWIGRPLARRLREEGAVPREP